MVNGRDKACLVSIGMPCLYGYGCVALPTASFLQ